MSEAKYDQPLGPVAAKILESFKLIDGIPLLDEPAARRVAALIESVLPADRQRVGGEIIAIAIKFARMGGEACTQAIVQLFVMAAALGMGDAAQAAFTQAGVLTDKAMAFLGRETAKVPTQPGKVSDPGSLFSLLAKAKSER